MSEPLREEGAGTQVFVLTLRWTCLECGWTTLMDAPGFAGDGFYHYVQPDNQVCGPLVARRERRV